VALFCERNTDGRRKVDLNDGLVHLANLSAGALAAAFAIALGVKIANGDNDGGIGGALTWRTAPNWTKIALSLCVWLYFIVGAIVLVVYVYDLTRDTPYAPQELNDFALVFAGYAVSFLTVLIATARPQA
jgi:hypothetical protein